MLNRPGTRQNSFRDGASLAALEFAIVLPLILALLAEVYDLSEAAIVRAEVLQRGGFDGSLGQFAGGEHELLQSPYHYRPNDQQQYKQGLSRFAE